MRRGLFRATSFLVAAPECTASPPPFLLSSPLCFSPVSTFCLLLKLSLPPGGAGGGRVPSGGTWREEHRWFFLWSCLLLPHLCSNSSPFRSQRLCCWLGLAPVRATILDFDSQFTLDPQVSRVFVCQPHSRSLMPTISLSWPVVTEDSTVLVTTSIFPRLKLAENHQLGSLSSPPPPAPPEARSAA